MYRKDGPIPSPDGPIGGVSSAAMADVTTTGWRARAGNRGPAVVALVAMWWLSACGSGGTSSPSPVAIPAGSGEPEPPAACAALDLRMPSGDAVQLTGRWRAPDGGTYYLRQVGSCVWFTGLSVDTDAPGGLGASQWTNAFLGTLQSDFTLHGEWADLPWGRDTGVGEITWRIDFAEVDGQEGVTLGVAEATGQFGADFLVRPEAPIDLHVRLQESPNCIAVVSDDPGLTASSIQILEGILTPPPAPSHRIRTTGRRPSTPAVHPPTSWLSPRAASPHFSPQKGAPRRSTC